MAKLFNLKLTEADRKDLDYLALKCPKLDRSEVIRRLIRTQAHALRQSWEAYEAEQAKRAQTS